MNVVNLIRLDRLAASSKSGLGIFSSPFGDMAVSGGDTGVLYAAQLGPLFDANRGKPSRDVIGHVIWLEYETPVHRKYFSTYCAG